MYRVLLLTAALLAAVAPAARADGRFPDTATVTFRQGSTEEIYLGVTFGLLVSRDNGANFYWVCEQNIGFNDGDYDPNYRVAADGTIYANTFDGLQVSRDGGCSFETATQDAAADDSGRIADKWMDAFDIGPDGAVWVGTTDGGRPNEVYRSTDAARTFRPLGLRSEVVWWKSILAAPSAARRAYVTGYQVTQTAPDGGTIRATVNLYRTDDAGDTWVPLPITDFQLATSPLVLVEAVAPDDPELVFARSVLAAGLGDKLYRSSDAGATWTEVAATTDTIQDVVMRADGSVFAATKSGTYRSLDRGVTFERLPTAPRARCLGDRGDALFSCGDNWEPDLFALGRSFDGTSWSKVTRFVEVKGPLSCPAGTAQRDVCEAEKWALLRSTLGIPAPPAPPEPPPPPEPEGCATSRTGVGLGSIAAAVVTAGLLMRRRRRRCCE